MLAAITSWQLLHARRALTTWVATVGSQQILSRSLAALAHVPVRKALNAWLAQGEAHERTLAVHVAAGLGSHVAVVVYSC